MKRNEGFVLIIKQPFTCISAQPVMASESVDVTLEIQTTTEYTFQFFIRIWSNFYEIIMSRKWRSVMTPLQYLFFSCKLASNSSAKGC